MEMVLERGTRGTEGEGQRRGPFLLYQARGYFVPVHCFDSVLPSS